MDELNGPIDRLSISQWWKHISNLRQCKESGSDPFLLMLVRKRFSKLWHVFKRAQIDSPEVPDASLRTKLQSLLPSIAQGKTFASTNELNHTLLLQIYDSIFKVDKGGRPQWYISAADLHRFTEGFLALSPSLANRLPSPHIEHQPELVEQEPPKKQRDNLQFCLICCRNTAPPHSKISSYHLDLHELNQLCIAINSIRAERPGREGRRKQAYDTDSIIGQKLCRNHLLINENERLAAITEAVQSSSSFRTPQKIRDQKKKLAFTKIKNQQASAILETSKQSLKNLTDLVQKFSSHISLSSNELSNSISEVSPLLRQFCESFRSFQGLVHPSSEQALLYSEWLNDIAFNHDTTFHVQKI